MDVRSQVPPQYDGLLLGHYLAQRFTYLDLAQWESFIEEGRIWYDGEKGTKESVVMAGGELFCQLPDFTPPDVNLNYTIVYEDPFLLGVNKPPNLRVHSGGRFVTANLMYHLRHKHEPPYPEALLVNRLDSGTSGVVLVARNKDVLRSLNRALVNHYVEKLYWGLVWGEVVPTEGVWEGEIGKVAGAAVPRFGVVGREGVSEGKTAVTRYQRLAYKDGISWLALYPETGRTHQLRVHTAEAGYPLVGDALYQMDDATYLAWLEAKEDWWGAGGLGRPALHSYQTSFRHPVSKETITVTAPLPEDWQPLLRAKQFDF
ncbi:MAG TPA: RluA family pseudouridine synthase [Anaerolineae bacterium]|nr:RluA family pseudouridine synthase [Anaerolineae bacterium]